MEPKLDGLLSRVLEIPASAVRDDLRYQSVAQWDSLRHVSLMLALEDAYRIQIGEELVPQLTSVAAIRDFVSRLDDTSQPPSPGRPNPPDPARPSLVSPSGPERPEIRRGLTDTYIDESRICSIDGRAGKLLYRGYSVLELAEHSSYEEVVWLLLHGDLPRWAELEALDARLREARALPPGALELIRLLDGAPAIDVLRTVVSALPALEDGAPAGSLDSQLRLIALAPTVLAAHAAIRSGRDPEEPDPTLSHAANFLFMLRGERPSRLEARLFDQDMILHAEHGANASAFAARVAIGAQADLHAAISAALATFSGSVHGGALSEVAGMLEEIGDPGSAGAYVRRRLAANLPIFGFGHRVYQAEDARAAPLRTAARTLSARTGRWRWFEILEAVREAMSAHARHGVCVNVDLYSCVTYHLLGIERDTFVAVFAAGRMAGWLAQAEEQAANNILIRPRLAYAGEDERAYRPMVQRTLPPIALQREPRVLVSGRV